MAISKNPSDTVDRLGLAYQMAELDVTTLIIGGTNVTATADEINEVADLSAQGALVKIDAVLLTATELGGSETATSFTFPAGAIFLNAWIDVTDAEAAATVDVGTADTSNDPDGMLDGVSLATLGYIGPVTIVGLSDEQVSGDSVTVTASGDLDSCEATLYIRYLELV